MLVPYFKRLFPKSLAASLPRKLRFAPLQFPSISRNNLVARYRHRALQHCLFLSRRLSITGSCAEILLSLSLWYERILHELHSIDIVPVLSIFFRLFSSPAVNSNRVFSQSFILYKNRGALDVSIGAVAIFAFMLLCKVS